MGKVVLIIMASINPAEKEAAEWYIEQVTVLQEKVGAKALYRFPITNTFIGEMDIQVAAAIEFPNREAFDAVFESDDYQALVPWRDKGFSVLNAFISNP